jgi:hypothetical membrane protein
LVADKWPRAYSWANNTISDLGNTVCTAYGGRYVCSPHHFLMNFSFIFLGWSQLAGALILYVASPRGRLEQFAFGAMALAGLGTVGVGVFPENVQMLAHGVAAGLPLLVGNVGLLLFGFSRWLPKALRWYSLVAGGVALLALLLFVTQTDPGIGLGAVERVAAYPQTAWLILVGGYLLFREAKTIRYNRKHHGRKQQHTV